MSRMTKTMLVLTIVNAVASGLFLTNVIDVTEAPSFYLAFPLAAVFYGMFLICRFLEKEVAQYDAEQRASHEQVAREPAAKPDESARRQGRNRHHHRPAHA